MGIEGPQQPQDPEKLINLFESLESATSVEARLSIEIEIIDCYIEMGKPKDEIVLALEELEISAKQEGLADLAETIGRKIDALI